MTEEKKLSPQERINLLCKKIDEIKELSDYCVILADIDAEDIEYNKFVSTKGAVENQAQLIRSFFNHHPEVYRLFQIFISKDIITKDTKMPTKKTNSPKLEDVLFNLCQQVEKQNNLLSGLVEAELAHNSSIQTLGGIIRGNLRANDRYNAKLRLLDLKQIKFASNIFAALLIGNLIGLILTLWK